MAHSKSNYMQDVTVEDITSSQDDFNDLKYEYINDYEAIQTALSDF